MTHTFYFHGSLAQYWKVLFSEYQRLATILGRAPFEFIPPNGQTIDDYVPQNGEEIIIYFRDKEHKRELLAIEAELLPDEEKATVHVFVHPQGNAFEEPVKSAMAIWKEIKKAINKASKKPNSPKHKRQGGNITNIYIGGDVKDSNIVTGDENDTSR